MTPEDWLDAYRLGLGAGARYIEGVRDALTAVFAVTGTASLSVEDVAGILTTTADAIRAVSASAVAE